MSTPLQKAIDQLIKTTPAHTPWTASDIHEKGIAPIDESIAVILNAIVGKEIGEISASISGLQRKSAPEEIGADGDIGKPINIAVWSAMKARRATKKEMIDYYSGLKGYAPFGNRTKAELAELIDSIISERNRKAYEEHREANIKVPFSTSWAQDNAEVRDSINSIFDDMPPVPLFGE